MEYILREHNRRNAFQEMLDCFAPGDGASGGKHPDGATGKGLASGENFTLEEEAEEPTLSRKDVPTIIWPGPLKTVECRSSG